MDLATSLGVLGADVTIHHAFLEYQMTPQDTMRLALELLEAISVGALSRNNMEQLALEAIEALRSALEQQGEQQPMVTKTEKGCVLHVGWDDLPAGTKLYAGAAPAAQHPTIEQVLNCYSPDDTATDYQDKLIDLFKAAPAAQPLKASQVNDCCEEVFGQSIDMMDLRMFDFARAIEAAHGIGVQK